MIVTVRATIKAGPVVSWFASEAAARDWRAAIVTAGREGVHVDGWLHDIGDGVLDNAREAAAMARRGAGRQRLRAKFATHDQRLRSGLVPLAPPADAAGGA